MINNLFKNIIDRKEKAFIIYENDKFVAFLDKYPKSRGHFLVVPKEQKVNFILEDNDLLSDLIVLAKKLAIIVMKVFQADGVKLISNAGKSAGQEIFHTHFHVLGGEKLGSFGS